MDLSLWFFISCSVCGLGRPFLLGPIEVRFLEGELQTSEVTILLQEYCHFFCPDAPPTPLKKGAFIFRPLLRAPRGWGKIAVSAI